MRTTVRTDGHTWLDDQASCVLVANVGSIGDGVAASAHATPNGGKLDVAVMTTDGAWQWPRTLKRATFGHAENSPLAQMMQAVEIRVEVVPHAVTVCVVSRAAG